LKDYWCMNISCGMMIVLNKLCRSLSVMLMFLGLRI
jgi:hypothetical protein